MTKDFPYAPLKGFQSVKCIICGHTGGWAYMDYIIEPLDKRKKKYGICHKEFCRETFQDMCKVKIPK